MIKHIHWVNDNSKSDYSIINSFTYIPKTNSLDLNCFEPKYEVSSETNDGKIELSDLTKLRLKKGVFEGAGLVCALGIAKASSNIIKYETRNSYSKVSDKKEIELLNKACFGIGLMTYLVPGIIGCYAMAKSFKKQIDKLSSK